jgi:hypothetical protein
MNYYGPFLTLLIALLVFHLLLVKYFPQNKRFWKKIDYVWVSLGIIGIFGATFSLNKEYFSAITPWHQNSLKLVYNEYVDRIESQRNYFLDENGFDYKAFSDKEQAKKFIQAGEFYDRLLKMSIDYKNFILVEEDFRFVDSIAKKHNSGFVDVSDDGFLKSNHKLSTFMLERIIEESNEISLAKDGARRGDFNWMLLFISPYLFALAVAIRITKITAELKDLK